MASCPRCAVAVPAYSRCDSCGLVLGFDGITVLVEFEESPHFRRVLRIAHRQVSCSEWREENGRQFLRVTYSFTELEKFRQLARTGAKLLRKHSFLNGLEIPWPASGDGDGFSPVSASCAVLPAAERTLLQPFALTRPQLY